MSASRLRKNKGPEQLVTSAMGPIVDSCGAGDIPGPKYLRCLLAGQYCYLAEKAGVAGPGGRTSTGAGRYRESFSFRAMCQSQRLLAEGGGSPLLGGYTEPDEMHA